MFDITIKNIYTFLSKEGKALNDSEQQSLNSVFARVDTEDKEGNKLGEGKGDGSLNQNEWIMFKSTLKSFSETLYNKFYSFINQVNDEIQYDYLEPPIMFDIDMYSDKALKKAFPENKYEILDSLENDGLGVTVIDKETQKEVLKITNMTKLKLEINDKIFIYNNDNSLSYEQDKTTGEESSYTFEGSNLINKTVYNKNLTYRYDSNGNYTISDDKTGERVYYDKNNNELKKDIDEQAFRMALASCFNDDKCTNEEGFRNLISKINESNALDILGSPRCHNNIHSYLKHLNNEELNPNINKSALVKMSELCEKAIIQAKQKGVYTDDIDFSGDSTSYYINKLNMRYNSEPQELKEEPITKNTKIEQGVTGNCWLLEKIAAMAQTDDGLEILNNMYEPIKNPDGSIKSVKVTVQGETYNISIEEIKGSTELSGGNLYVRAIEIGVFKYLQKQGLEQSYGYENDVSAYLLGINGGNSSMGSEILIGNGVELRDDTGSLKKVVDKTRHIDDNFMQELMNTQNAIIGVSTTKEGFKAHVVETGELEDIISLHAYSVVNKDDEYIYLIEPSNNKKTLRMTYEEFKNCFEKGDITPIKQPQENDEKVFAQSGTVCITFTKEDYKQMLNNPDKKQEIYKKYEQKIKSDLQERFDSSKYTINVIYNGRYFEYNILPKQR